MRTKIINLICVLLLLSSCSNVQKTEQKVITCDSIDVVHSKNKFYDQAYEEITMMLKESRPNFKRAAFLLEWAYLQGNLNYDSFCRNISDIAIKLKQFVKQRGLGQYKTAGNFALFEYFSKPNAMNGNKHYTYDFDDFTGTDDYTKLFVTKTLQTHSGQCRSLPVLYKILANEIGVEALLAQAPNHLYVKHLDENNRWVNVELTSGNLTSDAHIISSMGISAEAIRNGVYLDAMTEMESIAFILEELTHGYSKLFGYDDFVLQCCDKSLEYYPNNLLALFQKNNTFLTVHEFLNGKVTVADTSKDIFKEWKANHDKINELGFRDMPKDKYLQWVQDMENEKKKQKYQDKF